MTPAQTGIIPSFYPKFTTLEAMSPASARAIAAAVIANLLVFLALVIIALQRSGLAPAAGIPRE